MINRKRAGAKRALLIVLAAGTMMTSTLTVRADQEVQETKQTVSSESSISENAVSEENTESTSKEENTDITSIEADVETKADIETGVDEEASKSEATSQADAENIIEANAAASDSSLVVEMADAEEASKGTPHQVVDAQGKKYMVYDDGTHYTGWYSIAGCGDIYFDPNNNGAAAIGAATITDDSGTHTYIFDNNGVVRKTPGTPLIDGKKYWIKSDGTAASGWLDIGSWKMYFDTTTYAARTKADGVTDINGHKYLFNADGIMQNFAGTTMIDGAKYWFSEEGYLKNGWLKLGDWTLYFDKTTYKGAAGITKIDGKTYLFDDNGILKTSGTPMVNGKKYFVNADNELVSGWVNYGGAKMYFDPNTYQGAAGITTVNGKKLIFDSNGLLVSGSGTFVVNGKKYCIDGNGNAVTGWVTLGSWKMYFDPTTGEGAVGKVSIDGKTYYFNSDGINYVPSNNSNQSMFELAQGFSSDTQYLILVNRGLHRVAIYQGSKNNWKEIKYWPCVVGKPSTPTPTGTFKLQGRCYWFGKDHKCWWATKIDGFYFFHSQIYYWDDAPLRILDGTMDAAASAGCIRLEEQNAYFIFKEVKRGTTVHIYN